MNFIFTSKKNPGVLLSGNKAAALFQILPAESLKKHSPSAGDMSYLDISDLDPAEIKKALALLKKICAASHWGIFDPKGRHSDPASFFFEGASDYLGKTAAAGLSAKRLNAAVSWRGDLPGGKAADPSGTANGAAKAPEIPPKKSAKLFPGKFEGWKSIRTGTVAPFLFLYAALSTGGGALGSRLGEAAFTVVRNRLREFLQQRLAGASALLWMESESNFLFLVPPYTALAKAAVTAGLKLVLAAPLAGIENLGLSMPVDFTVALHYGKTPFQAPGKTGTVISDAVNFVFHLGAKHAEPGRLTMSEEVPAAAVPPGLAGLFISAGEYEGFAIRHSRRFTRAGE
ncbi:MAG: hypothetical protein LBI86_10210 [Treponema sp.]|jgi:hypothetical protein|nr:hypothetical protein [Treponema sp.]